MTETCVLAQSLSKSRQRWLTSNFKNIDDELNNTDLVKLGTAKMIIGPHTFENVTFYARKLSPEKIRNSKQYEESSYSRSSFEGKNPFAYPSFYPPFYPAFAYPPYFDPYAQFGRPPQHMYPPLAHPNYHPQIPNKYPQPLNIMSTRPTTPGPEHSTNSPDHRLTVDQPSNANSSRESTPQSIGASELVSGVISEALTQHPAHAGAYQPMDPNKQHYNAQLPPNLLNMAHLDFQRPHMNLQNTPQRSHMNPQTNPQRPPMHSQMNLQRPPMNSQNTPQRPPMHSQTTPQRPQVNFNMRPFMPYNPYGLPQGFPGNPMYYPPQFPMRPYGFPQTPARPINQRPQSVPHQSSVSLSSSKPTSKQSSPSTTPQKSATSKPQTSTTVAMDGQVKPVKVTEHDVAIVADENPGPSDQSSTLIKSVSDERDLLLEQMPAKEEAKLQVSENKVATETLKTAQSSKDSTAEASRESDAVTETQPIKQEEKAEIVKKSISQRKKRKAELLFAFQEASKCLLKWPYDSLVDCVTVENVFQIGALVLLPEYEKKARIKYQEAVLFRIETASSSLKEGFEAHANSLPIEALQEKVCITAQTKQKVSKIASQRDRTILDFNKPITNVKCSQQLLEPINFNDTKNSHKRVRRSAPTVLLKKKSKPTSLPLTEIPSADPAGPSDPCKDLPSTTVDSDITMSVSLQDVSIKDDLVNVAVKEERQDSLVEASLVVETTSVSLDVVNTERIPTTQHSPQQSTQHSPPQSISFNNEPLESDVSLESVVEDTQSDHPSSPQIPNSQSDKLLNLAE